MEPVEANVEQDIHHLLRSRKGQRLQLATHLVVVLVDAQHPCNPVERFRAAGKGLAGNLLPFSCQSSALHRATQFLPGGQLDEYAGFGILCLVRCRLEKTWISQAGELERVRQVPSFNQLCPQAFVCEVGVVLIWQRKGERPLRFGQWARLAIDDDSKVV